MIDYQRIFHVGHLVHDIRESMKQYSQGVELRWAKPYTYERLKLWTPEAGIHHIRLEVVYSIDGPQHVEIQKGPTGTFYDPEIHHGHHIGLWVDDVGQEARGLVEQGWKPLAAGDAPEAGWGGFCYFEPRHGGVTVELASVAALPRFENWWNGADGPVL